MIKKYEVTISWPIEETEFDAAKNAVDLKTVYSEFKSEYVAHATLSSGFVYCSETTDMKYSFPLPVHWLKEINDKPLSPIELIRNRFPNANSTIDSAHDKQFTWSDAVWLVNEGEKNAMKRVQPLVDLVVSLDKRLDGVYVNDPGNFNHILTTMKLEIKHVLKILKKTS